MAKRKSQIKVKQIEGQGWAAVVTGDIWSSPLFRTREEANQYAVEWMKAGQVVAKERHSVS